MTRRLVWRRNGWVSLQEGARKKESPQAQLPCVGPTPVGETRNDDCFRDVSARALGGPEGHGRRRERRPGAMRPGIVVTICTSLRNQRRARAASALSLPQTRPSGAARGGTIRSGVRGLELLRFRGCFSAGTKTFIAAGRDGVGAEPWATATFQVTRRSSFGDGRSLPPCLLPREQGRQFQGPVRSLGFEPPSGPTWLDLRPRRPGRGGERWTRTFGGQLGSPRLFSSSLFRRCLLGSP